MSPLVESGIPTIAAAGAGTRGVTFVTSDSPLTMLNYFDGKFLRASELKLEQDYLRRLVWLSNQGGGSGLIYGYDATLDGGKLAIGEGLAIDAQGRVLLLPGPQSLEIGRLLEASRRIVAPAIRPAQALRRAGKLGAGFTDCIDDKGGEPPLTAGGADLWVICVAHAQRLCGTEDVYGRLCEEACTTGTERPYAVEGIVVHARPLSLRRGLHFPKSLSLSSKHLRSQIAAAFFADERASVGGLISAHGLSQETWCLGADYLAQGCVPIALLARSGEQTLFLDAWTVRRERIETPPRRYWAWRMAMRPWDVYLAHILQFQCHLHEVLHDTPEVLNLPAPCAGQREVLDEASKYLLDIEDTYARHVLALETSAPRAARTADDRLFKLTGGISALASLRTRLADALKRVAGGAGQRVLINGGIIELPSAGYLPVDPASDATVNTQVRRLLGEGLDLRFCVVRPDFVPHALEEAQHMDRISLLEGLDQPDTKPEVDVLVPFGEIVKRTPPVLDGYDTTIQLNSLPRTFTRKAETEPLVMHGAGRAEPLAGGGAAFHLATAQEIEKPADVNIMVEHLDVFRGLKATELKKRADEFADDDIRTINTDPLLGVQARANLVSRFHLHALSDAPALELVAPAAPAPPAAAPQPEPAEFWSTMRSERNPFELRLSEVTPVSLEVRFVLRRTKATQVHLQLLGALTVTQSAQTTAAGQRMSGQVRGSLLIQTLLDGAEANEPTRTELAADAELLLSGDAGGGTLIVRLGVAHVFYQITAAWSGSPRSVDVKVSMGPNKSSEPGATSLGIRRLAISVPVRYDVAAAHLVSSSDVLTLGNPLRGLATSAIEVIGQHLAAAGQPGFTDPALLALFPPPPPAVDDVSVKATLDWVLFHRRRTKNCSEAAERPAPPATRRYAVYHVLATEGPREFRKRLAEALRTPNEITRLMGFQRVNDVEFTGGLPTLLTRTDAVLADWNAAVPKPGNTLVYAAIATSAASDAAALESARLGRLLQVLSPATRPDPTSTLESVTDVLPRVPEALAVPGADGIVFILSTQEVKTICHLVFRALLTNDVLRMLDSSNLAEVIAAGGHGQIVKVGTLTFAAGTPDPDPESSAAFKAAWGEAGPPKLAVVHARPGDAAAGDPALREKQARVAADLAGNASVTVGHLNTQGDWPGGDCAVVTILGVSPRSARIILTMPGMTPAGAVGPDETRPLTTGVIHFEGGRLIEDAGLAKAVAELKDRVTSGIPGLARSQLRIHRVEMALGGAPEAEDRKRLDGVMEAFKAALSGQMRSVNAGGGRPVVHEVDADEKPFLSEGTERYTDVLHVFVRMG
jgi:hypothetical protein